MDHHYDGRWIAPGFLCHLLYVAEHLRHDRHRQKDRVPSIGQSCQTLERRWDKCPEINGRMRLLHGLEIDIRLGHVEKLSMKLNWIGGPDGFEKWQKFIRQRAPFGEVGAGGIHFVFVPAKAQTNAEAAIG